MSGGRYAWEQLRMLIAEKLLDWAISVAPRNNDGDRLVRFIKHYTAETLEEIARMNGC